MPNEVINTIHQLAAACNKYKGIEFTDKDGNIINDENDDTYVTINDINIVREMNNAQLNNSPETEEEGDTEAINNNLHSHRYNLRPRPTTRNQKYTLTQVNNQLNMPKTHAHIMMTQLNVKEGIRQFGERGNEALLKELNQLHECQALMPKKKEDMSYEERKKALRYLMFIKEKRDTIKARGCMDGRSQREYTDKADTSSPTVSLEAMLLTCATDAKEGRYVAVTDIPGAFLHADMEQDIHMLLEGTIAELIVKLEPSLYRKFVWRNKHGKPMLYVKLKKALYGTLQAALLFWRLLSDTLVEWGFKLND